jgi:two-component system sensor histidine kinase MprB
VGETEVALLTRGRDVGYRRVLESNLEDLRDLADAIDNLVTICSRRRVEAGAAFEDFDLAEEARIRLERERAQAERHGIELALAAHGDLRMRGDREAILRGLRNLAANAIQWSPTGGRVDVALEGQPERILVTVDDAGPGVPEELRAQVFAPFFRGPAINGQRIGYGLGLAIVRSAVDVHGGSVWIGSSPRGGARFRVELPREPKAA